MRRALGAQLWSVVAAGALCLLEITPAAVGQTRDREVPAIVEEGFQAYAQHGARAALRAWLKGSPRKTKKDAAGLVRMLKGIEGRYGAYKAFHVSLVSTPAASTKVIYVVMDYTTGPLFAQFVVFQGARGWQVVRVTFHLDAERIWPSFLLVREGQAQGEPPESALQAEVPPPTLRGPPPVECAQAESSPRDRFASEEELLALLTGKWLLCSAAKLWGPSGSSEEQVGIEFTPDRHWFMLRRDPSGTLVRATGLGVEGTFQMFDTSSMNGPGLYQLRVAQAGGITIDVFPAFAEAPRKMRLTNTIGMSDTYVATP